MIATSLLSYYTKYSRGIHRLEQGGFDNFDFTVACLIFPLPILYPNPIANPKTALRSSEISEISDSREEKNHSRSKY